MNNKIKNSSGVKLLKENIHIHISLFINFFVSRNIDLIVIQKIEMPLFAQVEPTSPEKLQNGREKKRKAGKENFIFFLSSLVVRSIHGYESFLI